MGALIFLLLNLVASLFKSKSQLQAENAALTQQLNAGAILNPCTALVSQIDPPTEMLATRAGPWTGPLQF